MPYNNNFSNNLEDELDIPDDMFGDNQASDGYDGYYDNTPYYDDNAQYDGSQDTVSEDSPKGKGKGKKDKKAKEPKKSKGSTKGAKNEPIEPVKYDCILYIVTDRIIHGMVDYMRDCGLNVNNIFDNIETVRNMLLMQFNRCRIVVIDTGSGKFVTPTIRKELIDMIGVNDENLKFTVFYTDSVIKSDAMEALGKAGKSIEWVKYKTTPIVVAAMLSHAEENYIDDSMTRCSGEKTEDDILNSMGLPTYGCELEKMSPPIITASAIHKNVVEFEGDGIPKFNIKL